MAIDDSIAQSNERDVLSFLDQIIDAAGDFDSPDDRLPVLLLRDAISEPSSIFNIHVKRLLVNSREVLIKRGVTEEQFRDVFDRFISQMHDYQRAYFEKEVFSEKR